VDPIEALYRVAYLQDRGLLPTQKTAAFLRAAEVLTELPDGELEHRIRTNTLTGLPGIGPSTAEVIRQAVAGKVPGRIARLEEETKVSVGEGAELRALIKGDCHTHSLWSDGGASIERMARAAIALGHQYLVMTDHSQRLTVANGLNRARRFAQLAEIAELNADLAPFRILAGIEVDILDDGSLDCDDDVLDRLDVVVASVHSKLTMDAPSMTRRMLAAVRNPRVNILGHCTGRKVSGTGSAQKVIRPQSKFDARAVFAACAETGTAVEINCRPERQDPPGDLIDLALTEGCWFSLDTDAHSPGHLEFVNLGCDRATLAGIPADLIVTTKDADDLLDWTAGAA
jgi:putative hydrolase